MSFNYSPKIVTDGLILCLDAANPNSYVSGSTSWRDLSRGGNIGTLTNGPTYSGTNGGSIVFDGVNDYVVIPNNSNINISTNQISFGGWFYTTKTPNGGGNYQLLIGKSTGASRQYCMFLSALNTSNIYVTLTGTTFPQSDVVLSKPWAINAWNYIMLSYNGSTFNIYLNGSVVNTTSTTGNITPQSYDVKIGFDPMETYIFAGRISQTSIYNRALSAAEVLQNYNATKTRFGL